MKSVLSSLLLITLITRCAVTDYNSSPSLDSEGTEEWYSTASDIRDCTELCYSHRDLNYRIEEYYMFTGDPNNTDADIQWLDLETQTAGTAWIKKRANNNCRSTDPDDCLVWCMVEIVEHRAQFYVVQDTSTTTEFKLRRVLYYDGPISKSPHTYTKVLCADKRPSIQSALKNKLIELGYYYPEHSKETASKKYVEQEIINGLRRYQIDQLMCVAPYSLDLLLELGISL